MDRPVATYSHQGGPRQGPHTGAASPRNDDQHKTLKVLSCIRRRETALALLEDLVERSNNGELFSTPEDVVLQELKSALTSLRLASTATLDAIREWKELNKATVTSQLLNTSPAPEDDLRLTAKMIGDETPSEFVWKGQNYLQKMLRDTGCIYNNPTIVELLRKIEPLAPPHQPPSVHTPQPLRPPSPAATPSRKSAEPPNDETTTPCRRYNKLLADSPLKSSLPSHCSPSRTSSILRRYHKPLSEDANDFYWSSEGTPLRHHFRSLHGASPGASWGASPSQISVISEKTPRPPPEMHSRVIHPTPRKIHDDPQSEKAPPIRPRSAWSGAECEDNEKAVAATPPPCHQPSSHHRPCGTKGTKSSTRKLAVRFFLVEHDNCSVYLTNVEKPDEAASLHQILGKLPPPHNGSIKNAVGTFNPATTDPATGLPPGKRLAAVFLQLMRRGLDRSPVFGSSPNIELTIPLQACEPVRHIVIDGATVDVNCNMDRPNASVVYGNARFDVTIGQLQEFERSTRLAICSPLLPPHFFRGLTALTTRRDCVPFFRIFRNVPLNRLANPMEWNKAADSAEQLLKDASQRRQALVMRRKQDLRATVSWTAIDDQLAMLDAEVKSLERELAFLRDRSQGGPLRVAVADLCLLMTRMKSAPGRFGFASESVVNKALSLSLNEIASRCCLSQHGLFFTDGGKRNWNQIAPATHDSVVFLIACGPHFSKGDEAEYSNFFQKVPGVPADLPPSRKYSYFAEGGRDALWRRLREVYKAVYTSADAQHAKTVVVAPLGLQSVSFVPAEVLHDVLDAFLRAPIEALAQHSYSFGSCWIAAGQHKAQLDEIVQDVHPNCHVVVHDRSSRFLASELLKSGQKPAVLVPCNPGGLLTGHLGGEWEEGIGEKFGEEEDFAANSTMLLAHSGVSSVYLDTNRYLMVPVHPDDAEKELATTTQGVVLDGGGLETWLGVDQEAATSGSETERTMGYRTPSPHGGRHLVQVAETQASSSSHGAQQEVQKQEESGQLEETQEQHQHLQADKTTQTQEVQQTRDPAPPLSTPPQNAPRRSSAADAVAEARAELRELEESVPKGATRTFDPCSFDELSPSPSPQPESPHPPVGEASNGSPPPLAYPCRPTHGKHLHLIVSAFAEEEWEDTQKKGAAPAALPSEQELHALSIASRETADRARIECEHLEEWLGHSRQLVVQIAVKQKATSSQHSQSEPCKERDRLLRIVDNESCARDSIEQSEMHAWGSLQHTTSMVLREAQLHREHVARLEVEKCELASRGRNQTKAVLQSEVVHEEELSRQVLEKEYFILQATLKGKALEERSLLKLQGQLRTFEGAERAHIASGEQDERACMALLHRAEMRMYSSSRQEGGSDVAQTQLMYLEEVKRRQLEKEEAVARALGRARLVEEIEDLVLQAMAQATDQAVENAIRGDKIEHDRAVAIQSVWRGHLGRQISKRQQQVVNLEAAETQVRRGIVREEQASIRKILERGEGMVREEIADQGVQQLEQAFTDALREKEERIAKIRKAVAIQKAWRSFASAKLVKAKRGRKNREEQIETAIDTFCDDFCNRLLPLVGSCKALEHTVYQAAERVLHLVVAAVSEKGTTTEEELQECASTVGRAWLTFIASHLGSTVEASEEDGRQEIIKEEAALHSLNVSSMSFEGARLRRNDTAREYISDMLSVGSLAGTVEKALAYIVTSMGKEVEKENEEQKEEPEKEIKDETQKDTKEAVVLSSSLQSASPPGRSKRKVHVWDVDEVPSSVPSASLKQQEIARVNKKVEESLSSAFRGFEETRRQTERAARKLASDAIASNKRQQYKVTDTPDSPTIWGKPEANHKEVAASERMSIVEHGTESSVPVCSLEEAAVGFQSTRDGIVRRARQLSRSATLEKKLSVSEMSMVENLVAHAMAVAETNAEEVESCADHSSTVLLQGNRCSRKQSDLVMREAAARTVSRLWRQYVSRKKVAERRHEVAEEEMLEDELEVFAFHRAAVEKISNFFLMFCAKKRLLTRRMMKEWEDVVEEEIEKAVFGQT